MFQFQEGVYDILEVYYLEYFNLTIYLLIRQNLSVDCIRYGNSTVVVKENVISGDDQKKGKRGKKGHKQPFRIGVLVSPSSGIEIRIPRRKNSQ